MIKSLSQSLKRIAFIMGAAVVLAPSTAKAICNVDYVVQAGDNLFSIAEKHYGERDRWSMIYYRNQSELVGSSVVPGRTLFIPCPLNNPEPDATPLRKEEADLTLLTGNDFPPFTDRSLPGQGMVTELVNAALELSPSPVSYAVNWDDNWSGHLEKLNAKEFDMGFPWVKPDCESTPSNERCANFHFSDPLMVMPVMLFTRSDAQFEFNADADIAGKSICRPDAYFTHDLDREGRRWLTEEKITLVQPATPAQCFDFLDKGDVDAVSVNLFLGAATILELGLRDKVVPLERPLSEVGLHVVISKRHWRGTSHLYRVNAGLKALRESGRFEEIVSRHLEVFWSQIK